MRPITSRPHAAPRPFLASPTALALASLALPAAGFAQGATPPAAPASASAATLPTVKVQAAPEGDYKADTVSSPKFTQPLVDIPQTITVIKSDLIQQQGATTLTEALRNTPGVGTFFVGENGSTNTGDAVFMRGFDASSSIFVDGVRDLGSISRDTFNIDQIEVEKGLAGTDNGRGSPTGSINLVSKMAKADNFTAASLTLGQESQRRLTLDVNRQIDDTKAIRINLMGQESGAPGRDEVKNNRWGVAPSFTWGLGTPTRVTADYLHLEQNNVPDGGVPTIGLPGYTGPLTDPGLSAGAKVDSRNFYGTTSDFDNVALDMATLVVDHDFGPKLRLRNVTRAGNTVEDYLLTSFMLPATNGTTDQSAWTIARSNPTNKHQVNNVLANQTTLTGAFDTAGVKHDAVGGIEYTYEEQTTKGFTATAAATTGTWPVANLYAPDPHVTGYTRSRDGSQTMGDTNTFSAYAFDTLHFGQRFLLTGGLRLDHYKTNYNATVACGVGRNPACPAGVATGTIIPQYNLATVGNLWGWKIGGVYKPTEDGSVYVDYAISQQPPGGANFQLVSTANSANNPNFPPEKAKTFEVGTKWNLVGDALAVSAAWYRTDISNDIESDGGNPAQYFASGKKRVQGVELGVIGSITKAWSVNAGFTTMDTSVVDGTNVGADGTSNALNYTPKKAFTSWTTYELPFGVTVGGGARYSGKLQRGSDGSVGNPAYTNSYWVIDAMADYQVTRNLDLRLNVYNLADQDYVAAINKSGYRFTPGSPRYATITANLLF